MGRKAVHEEILELLPWFVNESLGQKEKDRVMIHLRECPSCRQERDELQKIGAFIQNAGRTEKTADWQFSYRKLLARIEEAERNRENTREIGHERPSRGWVPFLLAASMMVLAGIYFTRLDQGSPIAPDEFRTLTVDVRPAGSSRKVAVTFEQPIQAAALRKALIETRSNIVSGPDESGSYILEVVIPADTGDEEFLQDFRRIQGVSHAGYTDQ